jgi:DNA repair protein RAD50
MLASLLIRVALAEVFGGNCPILALDEPTTNLDASKVENMGTILKDLLEACQVRENQHHLQLIVITHDKRLVEHLFTACRPEYVYGLSKDENGVSKIRVHRSIEDESSVSTSFAHPKSLVF